ncbi:hypothetical protein LCGC14_2573100, partial [marine sediment metagenome]
NTLATASEVAVIGGGNDSNTIALYHFDGADAATTTIDGSRCEGYSENTIKEQGTYSLKTIALQTGSLNDTLTRTVAPVVDLSGHDNISIKVRASRTGSQFKIGIHDLGGVTTERTINIASANTWQTESWDVSGVSDANKDAIDSIIITITNANAENIIYIDDVFAGPVGGLSNGMLWNDSGTVKIYTV